MDHETGIAAIVCSAAFGRASDVAAGGNAFCQTGGAGTGKRQCLAEPPPCGENSPWERELAFLWLLGILLLLGRLFAGWETHQKQMEAWEEAPEEVMQLFHRCIPRGKGNVCIARDIKAPYISGFFTPTIALPPVRWPEEDLRLILLHEWQHFCNRDQWIKLVFYGFCCVFWWNPVMWLLKRQLDQLLELRCDFKVLEKLPEEERDSYYEMLLHTYRAIRTTGPGKAAEEGRKPWSRFYRHRVIQRFRLGLNLGLVGNKVRKAGRAL